MIEVTTSNGAARGIVLDDPVNDVIAIFECQRCDWRTAITCDDNDCSEAYIAQAVEEFLDEHTCGVSPVSA